jgi:hypothetical protein
LLEVEVEAEGERGSLEMGEDVEKRGGEGEVVVR